MWSIMSNPVVSDKMHYGLKPIAVKSKAHLLTVPCVRTNLYSGDTSYYNFQNTTQP